MKTKKNQIWNFNNEIDAEVCGEGVKRKILAYADEMMCCLLYTSPSPRDRG